MEHGVADNCADLLFITDRSFDITFDKEWP